MNKLVSLLTYFKCFNAICDNNSSEGAFKLRYWHANLYNEKF